MSEDKTEHRTYMNESKHRRFRQIQRIIEIEESVLFLSLFSWLKQWKSGRAIIVLGVVTNAPFHKQSGEQKTINNSDRRDRSHLLHQVYFRSGPVLDWCVRTPTDFQKAHILQSHIRYLKVTEKFHICSFVLKNLIYLRKITDV